MFNFQLIILSFAVLCKNDTDQADNIYDSVAEQ